MDEKDGQLDKNHFRQEIVRAQNEGLAKLRQAHLPDQQYLIVSQRIAALSLEHLRLLDQTYGEFEDYLDNESRSQIHQAWLADRAANLLQKVELAFDACVTTAIRHMGSEVSNPPREIREVIIEAAPAWSKEIKADWGRLPDWFRILALIALLIVLAMVFGLCARAAQGDTGPEPRAIGYGEEVSAQLSKTSQYNLWRFNGRSGDVVTITMKPKGKGNAMGIGLQDPNGNNVAFEGRIVGIYGGDYLSIDAFPLTTTGTHTISTSIGYDHKTKYILSLLKVR